MLKKVYKSAVYGLEARPLLDRIITHIELISVPFDKITELR